MKVLAVEDDALTALLLHESLERHGHHATIVRDGDAAWEHLNQTAITQNEVRITPFEVILTRWNAPRVNGLDLCRRLRHPDIGISGALVLLGMDLDSPENRQRAHDLGVEACLDFPLKMDELINVLEKLAPLARSVNPPNFATATATNTVAATEYATMAANHTENRLVVSSNNLPVVTKIPSTTFLGSRGRLGEILVAKGILTNTQLQSALEVQSLTREKLGTILLGKGWVTEKDILDAYSSQVDMLPVDVESERVYTQGMAMMPLEQALRMMVLTLESAEEDSFLSDPPLRAAISDPWNTPAIDLIHKLTRRRVKPVLAERNALRRAIEHAYQVSENTYEKAQIARSLSETMHVMGDNAELTAADQRLLESDIDATEMLENSDEAPVIRFVNTIIVEAVRKRASDIHIEPYKRDFEVRFRIDGALHVMYTLPKASYAALSSRIKIMSDLDIAERRMPQDGRVTMQIDGRGVQFRVSSLPILYGERIVLRVLDGGATQKTLDQLNFSKQNAEAFHKLIQRPHGIILVTGPTGSGKTTTLYAALNALKNPDTNIMTCEDPVEYEMDRISQSNVNPKAGLTFAMQLRSILRQDPDVVLIGEIRDGETAEIGFKAALTGHLVLSTLHCNEAAGAPTRLVDMGVEPYLIASALIGAQAQRLLRKLCPHCRTSAPPDADQQRILNAMYGAHFPVKAIGVAVGCARCNQLGTSGRIGVHEIMLVNEPIQQLIIKNASTSTIQNAAMQHGMIPMIGDGLGKVIAGMALLEDVQKKIFS
jgi:type IV pilus assembly protein PilB